LALTKLDVKNLTAKIPAADDMNILREVKEAFANKFGSKRRKTVIDASLIGDLVPALG